MHHASISIQVWCIGAFGAFIDIAACSCIGLVHWCILCKVQWCFGALLVKWCIGIYIG